MISKIKTYTALLLILFFNLPLYAAPNGGHVVHGSVDISNNGLNTTVNQNSNSAIINWDSFDINKGETVKFNQNSSTSIILNRVTNGMPTSIFGNILANGNVFIVNQAGILIGNGAVINTNSFLAGSANINDHDFINGNYKFYNSVGSIINNGKIKVNNGGYAVLLGKKVENNGLISAKLGKINLASGETFRLDMSGNDLIGVVIDKGSNESYILNTGKLHSEGGIIVMTAKNISSVIRNVVNNTGVIDASSISYHGGKVVLGAGKGTINNQGEINVSSQINNAGSIDINGNNVINSGYLTASGLNGGNIHLYADNQLTIQGTSLIKANALGYGNGGKIYLISPNTAESYSGALIEANSIYGKGGFIELSGHKSVYAFSNFDTSSFYGSSGIFLLDPSDMFIGNYADLKDKENNKVSKDGNTYVDIKWLNKILEKSNIVLKTLSGNGAGNITLNSGIDINGINGLTLNAANNINLLGTISVKDLFLKATGNISGNNSIKTSGNINVISNYGNIQLTKLNIGGVSQYISNNGSVSLVGDNIGLINQISGKTVGIEITGTGNKLESDDAVTDRAVVSGNEITIKSEGDVDISVNTDKLTAESSGILDIENFSRNEVVLYKYLGADKSTYSQIYGKINLSHITENTVGNDLTVSSAYGTIFLLDRLKDLNLFNNKIHMYANNIYYKENNNSALIIDNSLLVGEAGKYIFDNIGDIKIDIKDNGGSLTSSGLEVISRKGIVKTISPLTARYFAATAHGNIDVKASLIGGVSLISHHGNINLLSEITSLPNIPILSNPFANKDLPNIPELPDIPDNIGSGMIIRGLKAMNGKINVTLKNSGNLFVSNTASKNPINFDLKSAEIVSISGSGDTPLNINLKNGINTSYSLGIANGNHIKLVTNNKNYKNLLLKTGGILDYGDINNINIENKLHITADNIKNSNTIKLTSGEEIFLDIKNDDKHFILDTKNVDLNGGMLNVEFLKNVTMTDLNNDKYAGNISNYIYIKSKENIVLNGLIYANKLNIYAKNFTFGLKAEAQNNEIFGKINGNNIAINTIEHINGLGRIEAYKVSLTGKTIGATDPLLILADYADFSSTFKNGKKNDTLININTDNWIYGYRTYNFNVNGNGISYIGGRLINYVSNYAFKTALINGKLPIEDSNIDKVYGDYLINYNRLITDKELITVEKIIPEKITTINKKNKHIELK